MRRATQVWGWIGCLSVMGFLQGCSCGDSPNNAGGDTDASIDGSLEGADGSPYVLFGDAGGTKITTGTNDAGVTVYFCKDSNGDGVPDVPCECNDGIDNDGDGKVDVGSANADAECISARDDSEANFGTGLPGDNVDTAHEDCFFDGNSGAGDDRCGYDAICLCPLEGDKHIQCSIDGKKVVNFQNPDCSPGDKSDPNGTMCINFCTPFVPNGCDCFGCCTFYGGSTPKNFIATSSCHPETGEGCTECVQNTECGNPCGECELCPGKTTVPSTCGGGTGNYTCDGGKQVCKESNECPGTDVCVFGCCGPTPII